MRRLFFLPDDRAQREVNRLLVFIVCAFCAGMLLVMWRTTGIGWRAGAAGQSGSLTDWAGIIVGGVAALIASAAFVVSRAGYREQRRVNLLQLQPWVFVDSVGVETHLRQSGAELVDIVVTFKNFGSIPALELCPRVDLRQREKADSPGSTPHEDVSIGMLGPGASVLKRLTGRKLSPISGERYYLKIRWSWKIYDRFDPVMREIRAHPDPLLGEEIHEIYQSGDKWIARRIMAMEKQHRLVRNSELTPEEREERGHTVPSPAPANGKGPAR